LKAANASKLSVWISEGIDSKLDILLPLSHTMILWAAAVCRVTSQMVFSLQPSGLMKGMHVWEHMSCKNHLHISTVMVCVGTQEVHPASASSIPRLGM
jgi:hypothetical protein